MSRAPRFQRNPIFVNHVQDLVHSLVSIVFLKEKDALNRQLTQLIEDNNFLGGHHAAFLFDGEILTTLDQKTLRGVHILPIHETLEDRAESYVEHRDKVAADKARIEASFSVVTPKCRNTQDIRDALPDALAKLVPALEEMPRTRPEDALLENSNPVVRKQFKAGLDLLFDYQFREQMDLLTGYNPESII